MKKPHLKILLLENIHPMAREMFKREGYEVEALEGALSEEKLKEKVQGVHVIGIRSKTQIPASVLDAAKDLITLGCFCVGTNQVDLERANTLGIPVFNAPFSNTRSVAEMVIAEIIMLSRELGNRNTEMQQGVWNKKSKNCFEVRGKTLGIVGYGNIGTQVSHLAEMLGMRVVFFDIISKLSLGNSKPCSSLTELLQESDFVTLHVPATELTQNMIGEVELREMKKGSYLINASRGNVVVIEALAEALRSGHLAGAAVDVFPVEPEVNVKDFKTPLQGLSNMILTPHIGGATEEAQANIGREVAAALLSFVSRGSTLGSVNFPVVDVPLSPSAYRLINVHKNVPGVLKEINRIVSEFGANIEAQGLATDPQIGYLVMDINRELAQDVTKAIASLPTSLQTRMVHHS